MEVKETLCLKMESKMKKKIDFIKKDRIQKAFVLEIEFGVPYSPKCMQYFMYIYKR